MKVINSTLDIIKGLGDKVLKGVVYIGIGAFSILTSKITILMLVISLGMALVQVSTGFREEVKKKEKEMMYNSEIPSIDYYYDLVNLEDYGDNMAITDMIHCYQDSTSIDKLPSNIVGSINELEKMYSNDSRKFSFLYQDLFSGFTISYNADGAIFTASTIKAPAMIYIYENASLGKIDLNEKLVYTSNFYHGGSGVIQTKPYNTEYTIEELLQYTIYESDNIAYKMLMHRFGRENIYDFWKNKGAKNIFKHNTIWGYTSTNDALLYMRELYRFSRENEEYGPKLLEHFKKAKWKLVTDKNGEYNTANKGGWSNATIHDVAIVFDENPYVLAIMTNLGDSNYKQFFSDTSKKVGRLHEEYWKYKVDTCSNIKLY